MNDKLHAEDMLKVAIFAIGQIKAMKLNVGQRSRLFEVDRALKNLMHSIGSEDGAVTKIRA
jgi:hypothetical protein